MNECSSDLGGYFIVKGNEKVIVSQERIFDNRPLVFRLKKPKKKMSHVLCVKNYNYVTLRHGITNEIRISCCNRKTNERFVYVSVPCFRSDVPLNVAFYALGCKNDRELLQYVLHGENISEFKKEVFQLL